MDKQYEVEEIMEVACDLCRWPFVCMEEELEEKCEGCPLVSLLRKDKSAE